MKHVRRFLLVLLIGFLAIFYFQNRQSVGLMFTQVFPFRLDLPFVDEFGPVGIYNAGLLGASLALGALAVSLLGLFRGASSRSKLRRSGETVKDLERKVEELEKKLLEQKVERLSEKPAAPAPGTGMFQAPK